METTPSEERPLIMLNPAANRGHVEHYRALIRGRVTAEQAEYVETSSAGEARERAVSAVQAGREIIIVGGDGSIHEVVNGILSTGRRVPLGIVPAGSGNDYACNTLKLPLDPAAALERALTGQLVESDAGMVNNFFFANSCSVGLDADIAVAANSMKKVPFMSGSRLYYATTLKQLLFGYGHCPQLSFTVNNGTESIDVALKRYVLLAITNGPTYGAGFRINPTADYQDGLLDICAIHHVHLPRALRLLPVVQKGEHGDLPEAVF
ncbi:MAG: diacylglycerol kinase family protein, partial [Ktedonobacteraceae bacterium]